jgi:hypothetical protein
VYKLRSFDTIFGEVTWAAAFVPEATRTEGIPEYVFCGEACEAAATAGECGAFLAGLGELTGIAAGCSVDVDLLRILLWLMCSSPLYAALVQARQAVPVGALSTWPPTLRPPTPCPGSAPTSSAASHAGPTP